MSKHFEDARYYLKRAGEHTKLGVEETLEPAEARVREWAGWEEEEPEPSRVDAVLEDVKDLEGRAEGETREAFGKAREKIETYRDGR